MQAVHSCAQMQILRCKISETTSVLAFALKALLGKRMAPSKSARSAMYLRALLSLLSIVKRLVTKAITPPGRIWSILVQPGCSGQVIRPAFPVPGQTIRRALGKGEIFFGFAWHSVPPFNLVVNKKASGLFRSLAYGIYGSLFVFCGKLFCHLQQTVDG